MHFGAQEGSAPPQFLRPPPTSHSDLVADLEAALMAEPENEEAKSLLQDRATPEKVLW